MSRPSPLQEVLQRPGALGAEPAAPSLWAGEGPGSQAPSLRLRLLQAHGAEPPRSALDRKAQSLSARAGRWTRALSRLSTHARHCTLTAQRHSALDADAFACLVDELASACRLQRPGRKASASPADVAALAGVAEAVRRIHGFSPHVEQLTGALALLEGRMVEMATGEGKTLTAAMAAIVAAWRGLPCHVVTANDYLAARDAEIGQALFALCRVTAASVTGDTAPEARAAAYNHDIVYTTAKELLADHLRDGLALGQGAYRSRFALSAARHEGRASLQGVVMRGIHQVIVDEADSVLIDEAVTPLIISAQRPDDLLEQAAQDAVRLARALREGEDYRLQRALRHVEWTDKGRTALESLSRGMPAFWSRQDRAQELVQMALYAMHLMVRDQHYVVEDDKVVLVDELTGRLARQRTLSVGMQQVLEVSLGLPISPPSEVSARFSFQRFFQRFPCLGGMTGTAEEARSEFARVYGLSTLRVPTHRPVQRRIWPTQVQVDEASKFEAIAHHCQALLLQGRAVLVGVRSVRASQALRQCLSELYPGLQVQVLHALHHEHESAIVAEAGRPGALTIATNMAGRGTDIALEPSVREQGGLHVVIAESNDFARIDRQLLGRCARQGDPGTVQRFVSFDEEVIRRFLPRSLLGLWRWQHRNLPGLDARVAGWMLGWAQRAAERLAFRQRQNTLQQDLELERNGI